MKQALRYGQEIYPGDNNSETGPGIIYHIFPKLLYDNWYFDDKFEALYNINHIQFKLNLNDEVDQACIDILSNPSVYYIYSNTEYHFSKLIFL